VDEDAIATSLASGAGNTVLGNDTDIDPPGGGNILSVNTTPTTAPNHGTLTLFADGTFSYDHDGSENFSDSFVYEVCDDGSPQLCDTATVNITINPLNDPPVNTVPQSTQNTNEDTDLVINGVSVSDDDIGSGDMEVTLTAANGVLSLNVTTRLSFSAGNGTDDATMTFTGQIGDVNTALAAITYSPTQDYNFDTNSSTTTIVLITDDQDATNAQLDTDTITINVAAINDEPEFDPISNLTLPENTTSHAVTITGVGPGGGSDEASQNLSWSVVSGDASLVSIPSNPISGSGMTRTLTIGPLGAALVGTTNITVTLTDSGGTANPSDDDTLVDVFQLTVTAVNDPPVFNAISNPASTAEGNMSPPTVSITGVGPGGGADEAGQCVDVSATSSDTNIVPHPTISSSGCVTGASTRTLTYVPANPDAFGNVTITVTAQDNGGTSNPGDDDTTTSTFQVTITNVNDPPTFNNISNQPSVAEDSGTTIISITGVDPGGGVYESSQTVSFSATFS
jgi:VCBS repeat-containing protein